MTVERSGSLQVARPWAEVWDILPAALRQARMSIESADPSRGLVSASAPASFRSWGEQLEIWCTQGEGDGTAIHVRSKSKVGLTLVDYGKSQKNVDAVLEAISAWLRGVPEGWYPDPDDPSRRRWWNGTSWAARS